MDQTRKSANKVMPIISSTPLQRCPTGRKHLGSMAPSLKCLLMALRDMPVRCEVSRKTQRRMHSQIP